MPLHVRDMLPPARELIEEHELQLVTPEIEDIFERDEATGVLVRVGTTNPAHGITQMVPTGRMVERYETPGEGDQVIVHEGSWKQVDLHCGDCGSLLKPANDRDFYYLLCSRLNDRNHAVYQVREERDAEVDESRVRRPFLLTWNLEGPDPYENCVVECGGEPLGDPHTAVEAY